MIATIRGAITVKDNDRKMILDATKELLNEILKKNNLDNNKIMSIFFSSTKDLTKVYPAVGAREMGFITQSLMCFQEMYVENSLSKCIRVCILVDDISQEEVKHVYLEEAKKLRPDIR